MWLKILPQWWCHILGARGVQTSTGQQQSISPWSCIIKPKDLNRNALWNFLLDTSFDFSMQNLNSYISSDSMEENWFTAIPPKASYKVSGLVLQIPWYLQLWSVVSLSVFLHLSFPPRVLTDTGLLNSSSATMSTVYCCLLEQHLPDRRLMMSWKVSLMRQVILMALDFLERRWWSRYRNASHVLWLGEQHVTPKFTMKKTARPLLV